VKNLTKDDILGANLLGKSLVPVEVPELGGKIYVRRMSGADRAELESQCRDPDKIVVSQALIVICSACDEKGVRLFDMGELGLVSNLPFETLDLISSASDEINLITLGAQARARKN
jgi:hypothetical protein